MPAVDQPAAVAILALTVGISLLGMYRVPAIINRFLFRPYWFLRDRQYDTMLTSGLIHADAGHLLFNMVTFYFFGFPMERHLGTLPFLSLYVVGLVLSHGCTWVKERRNPRYASLGASGAISAVLFAYIVYFPTATLFIIPFPFPIPAVLFAVGYVAWSWWASRNARDNINHDAHLCGALAGIGFVAVTDPDAFTRIAALL
ncbi:MAG: rhomboid family intramembrane serine protease [Woeseiaceae bacterium]|nr:rhomboid family intramembrane serine protease [Woeseiaceae bacterium]